MTPVSLITTSFLLAAFVLVGGSYGCLYAVGRMRMSRGYIRAGLFCLALQILLAFLVCAYSPLTTTWKIFIVANAFSYAALVPLTWWFLKRLHKTGEKSA